MRSMLQDLRYALRSLRRAPGFAIAALVALGLGIGVTGVVFSVGNGMLWRPLPVAQADRLAVIFSRATATGAYADLSLAEYRDFRAELKSVFSEVIAYYPTPLSLAHGGQAERIWGEMTSANYFSALGVTPALGRGFLPGEDESGAAPVAVLSYPFWRSRFGDTGVQGRTVKINGHEFSVVGVAPEGFQSPYYVGFQPAAWVNAGAYGLLNPGSRIEDRGQANFRMLGRLASGATIAQAEAAAGVLMRRLAEQSPATFAGQEAAVLAERDARPEPGMAREFGFSLKLFLVVALLVLLVACANVASLLLARALARRREIAVRVALGAGRGRLLRQMLVENLVLAVGGGGLGLLLAWWLSAALARLLVLPTDIPFAWDFTLDLRVVSFTALITLLTTFAFGLIPALQASSPALAAAMRREASGWRGARGSRLRDALVVGQLAVCCLLLAGAGLVVRSLDAMRRVSLGFETSNALLVSVAPGLMGYDDARVQRLYLDVLQRVRNLPGVRRATAASFLPLEFSSNGGPIQPDGGEVRADETGEPAGWSMVASDYFATVGTPILQGRDLGSADTAGAPSVAVVSRTMASRLWPHQPAVGRSFHYLGSSLSLTVVGVVEDAKYRNVSEPPTAYFYLPMAQNYRPTATLVVRTEGEPLALLPALRRELAAVDADLPIADVKTFDELVVGRALIFPRLAAGVAGAMGLLALILALVGLYGVVAYAVAQRTREMGIRLALGATGGNVVRLMLGAGLRLVALGVPLGLAAAVGLGHMARSLLYGVAPLDPVSLGGTIVLLALVTLVASWLPARRAARLEPTVVLKQD